MVEDSFCSCVGSRRRVLSRFITRSPFTTTSFNDTVSFTALPSLPLSTLVCAITDNGRMMYNENKNSLFIFCFFVQK